MPLKYIRDQVAAVLGYHPDTSAADKVFLDLQINRAGKELHESQDLIDCLREQLFQMDTSAGNQQVALPHYVFQYRAMRNYYTRRQLTVHDMRPRFQSGGWTESLLTARVKQTSPLKRELANFAPLTLTIPAAEDTQFSVAVTGSDVKSSKFSELITFCPGQTSKQMSHAPIAVDSIANVNAHTYDVTVTDADCNIVSVLPNTEREARYIIVQMVDFIALAPNLPYMVEVLYKIRFVPLVADYDEFCCPGYDDALIYKTLEYLYARKDLQMAGAASAKCALIVRQRADDAEQGIEKKIEFVENRTIGMFTRPRRYNRNLFPGAFPP